MKRVVATAIIAMSSKYLPETLKPWKVDFVYNPTLEQITEREAKINNLRPEFLKALITQESNYKAHAISITGNVGCMQLGEHALKFLGMTKQQALVCEESIKGGSYYLGSQGRKELNKGFKTVEDEEFALSQWYYCGGNYYGRVIYDKQYKRKEICGTSYALSVRQRVKGSASSSGQIAKQHNPDKKPVKKLG